MTMGKRTKDLLIFLFFVLVSGVFWFVQELDENLSTEVIVPVKLVDIPADAHITNNLPNEIKATVQDKGGELLSILLRRKTDTLRIRYTNSDRFESGCVTLQRDTLAALIKKLLPNGANIVAVSPGTMSYSFFQGEPTRLPIRLSGKIDTDAQFCVDSIKFIPDSIDVYADRQTLSNVEAIYTEPVDTSELVGNTEFLVKLHKLHDVFFECDEVLTRVVLGNVLKESIEIPIVAINFPATKTLRTFPSTVQVNYRVPEKDKNTLNTDEFKVILTYEELIDNKTGRCNPRLNSQPKGVIDAHIQTEDVSFLFENVESSESKAAHDKNKKKKSHR